MRRTGARREELPKPEEVVGDLFEAPGGPTMGPGFERIIRRVFTIDEFAVYERLEEGLRLGTPASRAEYGVLLEALEESEDNAREAHRLYVNGRVALDDFEADAAAIEADMRTQASSKLEAEKTAGERSKAPTIADIQAKMVEMFPDEVRDLSKRRSRAKNAVLHFERLADLWKQRCRDLDVMVQGARH